jgi:hypothetical protein
MLGTTTALVLSLSKDEYAPKTEPPHASTGSA